MTRLGVVLSVLALFLFPTWAGASLTWDVTTDFNISSNPTGVWSYGWKTAPDGALNLYNTVYTEPQGSKLWIDSVHLDPFNLHTPDVYKNLGTTIAYRVAPGEVALHPSWLEEPSVSRWTSPVTGEVSITGLFGAGDIGAMSYFIYVNNAEVFYRQNASGDESFSRTQAVTVGTTIDFMVGEGYYYGSTPLHATIQATSVVPLPSAIFLFAPGFAALVVIWRRFKKL
jgi:hypothetical protein